MIATPRHPLTRLIPGFSSAWAIPKRLRPSEWAARRRILSAAESSEPGSWTNLRAPYLIGPMDAVADPEITDVAVMKAAQVGMSEAMRNVLGYWIDQDPGPVLWVMPDQSSATEVMVEKLALMIRSTPSLAQHLSTRKGDAGRRRILLDNMEIHPAWSTSPQSLASRPKRFVVYDEVDKYQAWSGKEADPISLGNQRRTTYGHRSRGVILSTPTTRNGPIWKAWESSPVRLRYHVPCPHCGAFAPMAWSSVRWPSDLPGTRAEQGAAIEEGSLAWYACSHCACRIEERQRTGMVARGVWAADDHETVDRAGKIVGKRPPSRRVAFHIPALISPWVSWSQMAGEFIAAIGDDAKMMNWRNSRLGEPYEIRHTAIRLDAFDEKISAGHAHGVIPVWAGALLATADSQKDGFWYVIRAWGYGFRSRLIDSGKVGTLAELRARCLDTRYAWEGGVAEPAAPYMLAIDSGGGTSIDDSDLNLTDQVYQFALSDPARIYAIKGHGGRRALGVPLRQSMVTWSEPGDASPASLSLYLVNTGYFKDVLAARLAAPPTAADAWELHAGVDRDYCRQMCSEHKVIVRRGREQVATWVPVSAGAANHIWDCEVYQQAAAQIAHVETLPPPPPPPVPRPDGEEPPPPPRPRSPRPIITTPDGRPFLLSER